MYKNNWLIAVLHMAKRISEIPEFVTDLGKRIREIRKKNKMSIEEVAYKAGLDAQNLRKYELGKQEMKISMLKRISESLETSCTEILKGL